MTYRARTLLKAACGLAALIGLGLFAYHGVHKRKQREARENMEAALVFRLDKEQVVKLEVESGKQRTVLERAGTDAIRQPTWSLVEPVRDEGDAIGINSLLGTLERMDATRTLPAEPGLDPGMYGLDPPRGRLVLTMADGSVLGLLVGKKSSYDGHLYVQRQGEQDVLVTQGDLESVLLKSTFDLRRKEIVRFNPEQVDGLRLQDDRGVIELAKRDGIWNLQSPVEDRADHDTVHNLLNTLLNLRAISMPTTETASDSSFGLDPPGIEVELRMGPERKVVALGAGKLPSNRDRRFARRKVPPGPRAEIRPHQHLAFRKTPFALQAKTVLAIDPEAVFKIRFSGDQELVVLERRQGEGAPVGDPPAKKTETWSLVAPKAAAVERYKVTALLNKLVSLKASSFAGPKERIDLGVLGLNPPRLAFTLYDREGADLGSLSIGKQVDSGTYLTGPSRPQVCLVETGKIERIQADVRDLQGGGRRPDDQQKP